MACWRDSSSDQFLFRKPKMANRVTNATAKIYRRHTQSPIKKATVTEGGHQKILYKCTVCSQPCQYFYYGVKTCEGCKHFFRRSVSMMKEYFCVNRAKCDVTKGAKCKRCRLDRCILVGMNARGLGNSKFNGGDILDFVEKRRVELANNSSDKKAQNQTICHSPSITMADTNLSDQKLLEYLVDVEQRVRRIRDSRTMVPEPFYEYCSSFGQILARKLNLIECSDQFSTEPPKPMSQAHVEAVQKMGPLFERPLYLCMDLLFVFEIAKTLPFFEHIENADKVCLLSTIAMPLFVLCNGFYSCQQNADTFVTPMGYAPIEQFTAYNENKIAMSLGPKVLCDVMKPFVRASLDTEEFVLLRAIIYSHMVSSGLSDHAQQILLCQANRYSSILLNLMQTKYGTMEGARKYAELLMLIEFSFNSGGQHRQWLTYVANVLDRDSFRVVMPPALAQLCTQGSAQWPELAPI